MTYQEFKKELEKGNCFYQLEIIPPRAIIKKFEPLRIFRHEDKAEQVLIHFEKEAENGYIVSDLKSLFFMNKNSRYNIFNREEIEKYRKEYYELIET